MVTTVIFSILKLFILLVLPFSLLFALDTSDMTEEQKIAEVERVQRLKEKNRMDALMAKQRIQSYKVSSAFVSFLCHFASYFYSAVSVTHPLDKLIVKFSYIH